MGTRSLTRVRTSGATIVTMYRQYDGYPEGHGKELAEFLSSRRMVNGLNGEDDDKKFNGPDCLAAFLVAHFKKETGGIYLYPPSEHRESYNYTVDAERADRDETKNGRDPITVTVENYKGEKLFSGNRAAFAAWCVKPEEEEDEDSGSPS